MPKFYVLIFFSYDSFLFKKIIILNMRKGIFNTAYTVYTIIVPMQFYVHIDVLISKSNLKSLFLTVIYDNYFGVTGEI